MASVASGFYSTIYLDIRYLPREDNVVVDAPSRIETVSQPLDYIDLATSQLKDKELQKYLIFGARKNSKSGLKLKKINLPGTRLPVYCDISMASTRLLIIQPFRRATFESIYMLGDT